MIAWQETHSPKRRLSWQLGDLDARILLAAWCLFWLLMVVISIQEHVVAGSSRWWEPFVWEGSSALMATTLGMWMLRRLVIPQAHQPFQWLRRLFVLLTPLGVVFFVAIYSFRHGFYALVGLQYSHEPWSQIVVYEVLKFILFIGLWAGIVFGLQSFAQTRRQAERLQVLQQALTQAQLTQLKAQLRPHFLFNTLNTISSLMQTDVARADRLLTRLGDLLRVSLSAGEKDTVPLSEELHLLRLYASIMEERFIGRVNIRWQVADDSLTVHVPTLLLQPLLENAFRYGVEPSTQPQRIAVSAWRDGANLFVTVCNTCDATPAFAREGVGLRNTRERLQVLYGDAASLSLAGAAHEAKVMVRVPIKE